MGGESRRSGRTAGAASRASGRSAKTFASSRGGGPDHSGKRWGLREFKLPFQDDGQHVVNCPPSMLPLSLLDITPGV